MAEEITTLSERKDWTVDRSIATYMPIPGGWVARVRAVRMAGHSYERWHIAVIDAHGTARYTSFASLLGEAARVAETRVGALSAAQGPPS